MRADTNAPRPVDQRGRCGACGDGGGEGPEPPYRNVPCAQEERGIAEVDDATMSTVINRDCNVRIPQRSRGPPCNPLPPPGLGVLTVSVFPIRCSPVSSSGLSTVAFFSPFPTSHQCGPKNMNNVPAMHPHWDYIAHRSITFCVTTLCIAVRHSVKHPPSCRPNANAVVTDCRPFPKSLCMLACTFVDPCHIPALRHTARVTQCLPTASTTYPPPPPQKNDASQSFSTHLIRKTGLRP